MKQPNVVTCTAEACRSAGFWQTTPNAYATAAARHSSTPRSEDRLPPVVEIPITTAPAKDTATPASSGRGKPSRSSQPPSSAIRIGPMLTTIAAVPASTCRSPQFSTTM
jgi:hypothetical protein